jgi:hypothetical protein
MIPVDVVFDDDFDTSSTGSSAALVFGVPGAPSFQSLSGTASAAIAEAVIPADKLHKSAQHINCLKFRLHRHKLSVMRHLRINATAKLSNRRSKKNSTAARDCPRPAFGPTIPPPGGAVKNLPLSTNGISSNGAR